MLRDKLTIVIPNKNEGAILNTTLHYLNQQKQIFGIKVIIADCSDITPKFKDSDYFNLKIKVIKGGLPAAGRLAGSELVDTPYMLFLDADMCIKDKYLLSDIMGRYYGKFDLLTLPFETDYGYNKYYRIFDIFQWFSARILRQPFAIGGFQLFHTTTYWRIGGYNPKQAVGEDYHISLKIKPSRFIVYRNEIGLSGVYTSARRLKNKGIWFMVKLMVKSWLNRHNDKFFESDHGYWK